MRAGFGPGAQVSGGGPSISEAEQEGRGPRGTERTRGGGWKPGIQREEERSFLGTESK